MNYVDGFVIAVPTAHKEKYIALASHMAELFKRHGALSVVETWGDDVPPGKLTSFPMAVKLEPEETVVFSWITWPSKEVRDAGNKKVMEDPAMSKPDEPFPFDGKRMIYGGFAVIMER